MVDLHIQLVTTAQEQNDFLDVPGQVYAQDPYWVPPLRKSVAQLFSPTHPFLQYGQFQAWIAVAKGRPLGRVVAAVNQRLVEREQQAVGLVGYFECLPDPDVAESLLDTACDWLGQQGMQLARGPINLSTHNSCAFLVDGFESSPMIMMPYNPPYYPDYFEQLGWCQAKDAYAYRFPSRLSAEFTRAYSMACQAGVQFRSLHTKSPAFEQDCINLYHLFNRAFTHNWSSSPRSESEFMEEARSLQSLVDPAIFQIAEYKGEMVGFFMALPDYNIALKHVNGHLNWLGILKFLWWRRQIRQARVIAICALPEHRRRMVAPALIYAGFQGGTQRRRPYQWAELSWVFEDNMASRRVIEAAGGQIYKTYRIYEKSL